MRLSLFPTPRVPRKAWFARTAPQATLLQSTRCTNRPAARAYGKRSPHGCVPATQGPATIDALRTRSVSFAWAVVTVRARERYARRRFFALDKNVVDAIEARTELGRNIGFRERPLDCLWVVQMVSALRVGLPGLIVAAVCLGCGSPGQLTGSGGTGGGGVDYCLHAPAGQDSECYPAADTEHFSRLRPPSPANEIKAPCTPGKTCTFATFSGGLNCGSEQGLLGHVCCDGAGFVVGSSLADCPVPLPDQDPRCTPFPPFYSACPEEDLSCSYAYSNNVYVQTCCRGLWSEPHFGCPADAGTNPG